MLCQWGMKCFVTSDVLARLRDEARNAYPEECCGVLLGNAGGMGSRHGPVISAIVPAANRHAAPCTHFTIDPQILFDTQRAARSGGPPLLGYYHSHPDGRAAPSATDQRMAHGDL